LTPVTVTLCLWANGLRMPSTAEELAAETRNAFLRA
jgi:hypothetical protein